MGMVVVYFKKEVSELFLIQQYKSLETDRLTTLQ